MSSSPHFDNKKKHFICYDTKIIKFRAKDSEIMVTLLCLGNMSKDFSIETIKKTELNVFMRHSLY